jgi:hypothetical protein
LHLMVIPFGQTKPDLPFIGHSRRLRGLHLAGYGHRSLAGRRRFQRVDAGLAEARAPSIFWRACLPTYAHIRVSAGVGRCWRRERLHLRTMVRWTGARFFSRIGNYAITCLRSCRQEAVSAATTARMVVLLALPGSSAQHPRCFDARGECALAALAEGSCVHESSCLHVMCVMRACGVLLDGCLRFRHERLFAASRRLRASRKALVRAGVLAVLRAACQCFCQRSVSALCKEWVDGQDLLFAARYLAGNLYVAGCPVGTWQLTFL